MRRRRDGYAARGSASSFRTKCINCKKIRACLLIEAYTPDIDGGYELHVSVTVCRTCLRDPVAAMTLASFLKPVAGGKRWRRGAR